MRDCSYSDRLSLLRLYSLQRRRERYCIIYDWKIIEDLVPNFSKPIVCTHSERRGRYCVVSHVNIGRSGTLAYNSFRWRAIRLFNSLPKFIRCTTSCSVYGFNHTLDSVMMTLFKSLVLSRLDYGSQLWSPTKIHQIIVIEKIQKAFTKHIKGFSSFSYQERLSNLKIYSLQRRRERYIIIYVWKILENLVPNLVKPLQFYVSDRRGRLCSVSHVRLGHTGTLAYSSFRWKGIRLFNSLPMHIRNITACPPLVFKKQLDLHLSPILDCPCTPNFNNSLDNKY